VNGENLYIQINRDQAKEKPLAGLLNVEEEKVCCFDHL